MVPEQSTPCADRAAIQRDLEYMTARWGELGCKSWIEIRAFRPERQTQIAKFLPEDIPDAVDFAANMNGMGYNVYAVRNPIRYDIGGGSASDADIVAAFFLWADCDDPASAGNVYRFDGPKWSAAVTTGRTPSIRVHTYWQLQEPCTDMQAWRAMQSAIAAHFGSDKSVINPSRIMRIGGTVAYPDTKKRSRGYVDELTAIKTVYEDARPLVTMEQMGRIFRAVPEQLPLSQRAAAAPNGTSFQIDASGYAPSLDREQMAIQALSGVEWHNAVIRLVGSYVARGLSDSEIHALTDPLTLAGYTVEQTRREVQAAIDGARRKGWTPEAPTFAPNFDHAPAPTPSDPAPQATAWRVQRADQFTADFVAPEYIVDGIIQRGRIYTLTAPTGSGKTAVMLYAATAIATGSPFCEKEVEPGDVLFMAGENPDDVRARVIATMEFYGIDPATCNLHFIAGTFSIRADMERLRAEAEKLPNLILVVIDTFAAYFDGDDENSNAQALDFARLVRRIAAFDAKPAVIMPAHPVKNATKGNLTPKGGSSLLNEVDGNLTLWNDGGILSMHWQGKFRGAEFEPLHMELQRYETAKLCDNQGRIIPTILAKPLLEIRAIEIAMENLSREDRVLLSIASDPALSARERCVRCHLTLNNGKAATGALTRILNKLCEQRLIKKFRTNWELTKDGEKAVEMLRDGQPFAKEI